MTTLAPLSGLQLSSTPSEDELWEAMAAGLLGSSAPQQSGNSALVRQLAASDKDTRDKGVSVLTKWLQVKESVSDKDLLKIWKGLFYCMWHSDKAPVQADLASNLSGIMLQLNDSLSLAYLSAFLVTIRREWAGIDRLRLDKFYMLIRMFLKRSLQFLEMKQWEEASVSKVVTCFVEGGFSAAGDKAHSIGVSLHLCDIFVSELLQFEGARTHARSLLLPLLQVLASEKDKRVVVRLQQAVFLELLQRVQEREDLQTLQGILPSIAEAVFNLAGNKETPSFNRKLLFDLHASYAKHTQRSSETSLQPVSGGQGHVTSPGEEVLLKDQDIEDGEEGEDVEEDEDHEEGEDVSDCGVAGAAHGPKDVVDASEDEEHGCHGSTKHAPVVVGLGVASLDCTCQVAVNASGLDGPKAQSSKTEDATGEIIEEGEDVAKGDVIDHLFAFGVSDAELGGAAELEEAGEEESGEEEVDGEEQEEGEEEPALSARSFVGSTPHVKKRRRTIQEYNPMTGVGQDDDGEDEDDEEEEDEDGSESPGQHSPPRQQFPPGLLSPSGLLTSFGDGFRTPEKHIVDAFSSAGFYTGEDECKIAPRALLRTSSEGGMKKKITCSTGDVAHRKAKRAEAERERKVRFVLDKNLEFPHGSAPAPPSVRTPPCSMPKGSALKPGVKPGPINMKKLIAAQETSPSHMTADGRKKRKRRPVRAAGLSSPQSLTLKFAGVSQ